MAVQVATRTSSSAGRLAAAASRWPPRRGRPAIKQPLWIPSLSPRRHWHLSTRRPTQAASHSNGPGRWPAGAVRKHWQALADPPGPARPGPGPGPRPGPRGLTAGHSQWQLCWSRRGPRVALERSVRRLSIMMTRKRNSQTVGQERSSPTQSLSVLGIEGRLALNRSYPAV
jgi:hypothetical protein